MSTRRSKHVVTILLLISAMFTSLVYFTNPQPVQAAPSLTLTPSFAGRGSLITVTGSGFSFPNGTTLGKGLSNPVSCAFFSLDRLNNVGTLITSPICTITSSNNSTFSGSFVVNGALSQINNPYVFTVNITDVNHVIKAQATFSVTAIAIHPSIAARGSTVVVNGSLGAAATTCTISGTPVSTASCVIFGSTGGNFNATFVVANVAPGPYTITVTGGGVTLQVTFTVTGPTLTLNPVKGGVGTLVTVSGTGFSFSDTTCTISSPTLSTIISKPACSMIVFSNGTRGPQGSFAVGNVAAGSYVIRVTGNPAGDFAEANFIVTTGPVVTLIPNQGPVGLNIHFNGTGFVASDTSCTVTGTPVTSAACTTVAGSGNVTGNFIVANVATGTYLITVTGNTGGVSDRAQAVFTVNQTFVPIIAINPPDGPRGTIVKISGNGFSTRDTTCQLSSTGPGGDLFLLTVTSCSISSGVLTAQFTVGTGATQNLSRAVNVTGNTGDKASISFFVDFFPTIRAVPTSGVPGTFVFVSLTSGQFSSGDQGACTISSSPGGLFSTSNCVIQNSGHSLNGTTFITSGAASGFYTITVKGSTGDSAFTTFTENFTASLVLSQNNATNGATITFRGTGFSISDSGTCQVLSYVGDISGPVPPVPVQNFNLVTSPVCTISNQVATGSFVVGPLATTDINWNVTVRGSPQNDIPVGEFHYFNVTASVTVSPSSGTIGQVFNFAGAGFSSKATFCGLPSFYPAGSPKPLSGSCGIVSPNSGEVAGSFIPKNVAPGVYVINVGDQLAHNASTTFTLGTPQAQLTISPNVIIQPVSGQFVFVGISGSGFNGNDTACTVTTYTGIASTGTCSISGGFASASLTVSSSVVPGLYLITVTGNNYGDFASNYLSVGILTTMISTSTTTTSFTSSTATTTLTTSTSISSSLTTTTFTSTGATTIVFPQQTLTTVSGVTTVVSTVTGSTTFPTTGTTTTTQTVTLGQAIQRSISDELGLLGMLLLLVPILLRRLFD